jgi:hypothetical protein
MTCIECEKHINDCTCEDIEDRLRHLIANGNSFASSCARRALYERLASKPLPENTEDWTDEDAGVLEYCLQKAWAEKAKLN